MEDYLCSKVFDMAITITPSFDLSSPVSEHPVFLSDLRVITLHGVTEPVTVTFGTRSAIEFFSNRYTPDSNGEVRVHDVDRLLDPGLAEGPAYIDISIAPDSVGYNVIVWHAYVFPANTAVAEPAVTFLPSFFLSAYAGPRDTAIGRHELLSAYLDEESAVIAKCHYLSADNDFCHETVEIATLPKGMQTFDVSPALFAKPDVGTLIGYEVICGERLRKYRVMPTLPTADPALLFRNCFGCWETFYLTGKKETTPSYSRSNAVAGGKLRNYSIVETVSHKVKTGSLRWGLEAVAMDVARSKAVFLLNPDGSAGDEITITDSDLKHTNSDSEILECTFTYRLTDSRTSRIHAPRLPKLFDSSFDEKFN